MNGFKRARGPRLPIDLPDNAYPLEMEAADVAASRHFMDRRHYETARGADPDWLSEAEAYDSHADYLADREAFDRGDYDDDPFREV